MSRATVLQYFKAQYPYDPEALAKLRDARWVMDWPQSGERIKGHENDRAINENYPGYPKHVLLGMTGQDEQWTMSPLLLPVRVSGGGDVWFGELWLEYPNGDQYFNVGVIELRNGKVHRDRWYWAAPFESPEWRNRLVERVEPGFEPAAVSASGTLEEETARRRSLARFLERQGDGDITGAMKELWAEDVVEEIPQSGEVINGLDQAVAIVENHPNRPKLVGTGRVTGAGDIFAIEAELDYSGDPWFAFEIFHFRGDKVARSVEYFSQPFQAPDWRGQWVEHMD